MNPVAGSVRWGIISPVKAVATQPLWELNSTNKPDLFVVIASTQAQNPFIFALTYPELSKGIILNLNIE